jgi:hypothetical protein
MTTPTTFTLTINGQPHTYSQDKEGKRQAILDGLQAIPLFTAGAVTYLPHEAALQVVADVLYPDGIETKDAYHLVCQVTERACAHLGYGAEVQLEPPLVAFGDRGSYRPQLPPLDEEEIRETLTNAGVKARAPYQEIGRAIVWQKAAWQRHHKHLSDLTPAEQSGIEAQVDQIASEAGWQIEGSSYVCPLPVDTAKARDNLVRYMSSLDGRPLLNSELLRQVTYGAYGRLFRDPEGLPAELTELITAVLGEHGYESQPRNGLYHALPLTAADEVWAQLPDKLQALTPVQTTQGPGLLLSDVETAVQEVTAVERISPWQLENLIVAGPVGQVLTRLGYRTRITWCQPHHFQPPLDGHGSVGVLIKAVRVSCEPNKKISLADGLSVFTPALTLDDKAQTLVYLEMVGAKQSVRANWAALMGKGKSHWFERRQVALDGMKEHVKVQSHLPCGWHHMVLIHKQASLKEMNPEQPFYLLDNGRQPIPPLFYPMLNKSLALPLLPEWSDYLWQSGRQQRLITLLDDGRGQGYAAWQVKPAPSTWQEVVQTGIVSGQIAF